MRGKLENIQALRGVAALMVLFAHIKEAEFDYGGSAVLLPHWLYMGVVGVDLFFLISGYVMVHVALAGERGGGAARRFLFNRAARIYPVYWVATLILMLLYACKHYFFAEATPFPNPVATFLLTPSDFYPLVPVGWTLVHEVYFYAVFAVFIFWRGGNLIFILGAWSAVILAGLQLDLFDANAWTKVVLNPLTFEFVIGALIAVGVRNGATKYARLALIAGISIFAAETAFFADRLYPDAMGRFALRAMLFAPPFALILYGAAALEETDRSALAPKWLRLCGDASYSLYLIHVPVFLVVGKVISLIIPDTLLDNVLLIIGFSFGVLAATYALRRYIEKPLLAASKKLGDRLFNVRSQAAIAQDKAW